MFLHIFPTSTVVKAIMISHLEYRNLLNGFTASACVPVQSILHFMSRATLLKYKRDHFTPLLRTLLCSYHTQIETYRSYYGLQASI